MKTTKGAGTTAKHAGTAKHVATKKHAPAKTKAKKVTHKKATVHAKTKHATHAKAKGLALGEMVACCTIEALAASLSLLRQGLPVADSEVLDLFRLAGGDEERGMPIAVALEAASEFGLAGFRPVRFEPVDLGGDPWQLIDDGIVRSLILGVDLPGPHAVCDDGSAWWSWGKPHDIAEFPDAVIDEAWAVTWA